MKTTCIAAATLMGLGIGTLGAAPAPEATLSGNASALYGFANTLLVQHRAREAFDAYAADDLIQHNPAAKDGRSAAIALVAPLMAAPGAHFAVSTLIADGEFGFMFYRGQIGGPGQGAAVAELYRLQAGRLAEHWDAFQPIPPKAVSAHPMFGAIPAALPLPCTGATAADRATINGFADLLYRQRNVRAAFERYAAPDMIQHDPGLPDGPDATIAELTPILSRPATRITVAHILACRGMGVIHLRSQFGASPGHVIFDIMRIEGGRIVEHWDVFQPVTSTGINSRDPL